MRQQQPETREILVDKLHRSSVPDLPRSDVSMQVISALAYELPYNLFNNDQLLFRFGVY